MFYFPEPGSGKYPVRDHTKATAEIVLIRALLRLEPFHDTVTAVRILHDEGRAAFEAMRDGANPITGTHRE